MGTDCSVWMVRGLGEGLRGPLMCEAIKFSFWNCQEVERLSEGRENVSFM